MLALSALGLPPRPLNIPPPPLSLDGWANGELDVCPNAGLCPKAGFPNAGELPNPPAEDVVPPPNPEPLLPNSPEPEPDVGCPNKLPELGVDVLLWPKSPPELGVEDATWPNNTVVPVDVVAGLPNKPPPEDEGVVPLDPNNPIEAVVVACPAELVADWPKNPPDDPEELDCPNNGVEPDVVDALPDCPNRPPDELVVLL